MTYILEVSLALDAVSSPPNLFATVTFCDGNGVTMPTGYGIPPADTVDRAKLASYLVSSVVNQWNVTTPPQPCDLTTDLVFVAWGGAEVTGPYNLVAAIGA